MLDCSIRQALPVLAELLPRFRSTLKFPSQEAPGSSIPLSCAWFKLRSGHSARCSDSTSTATITSAIASLSVSTCAISSSPSNCRAGILPACSFPVQPGRWWERRFSTPPCPPVETPPVAHGQQFASVVFYSCRERTCKQAFSSGGGQS